MSMLGRLARVSPAHLDAIRLDPDCAGDLLDHAEAAPTAQPNFFRRLFGKANRPEAPARARKLSPLTSEDLHDVDQYWHVLHFLFTGSAWGGTLPQAFLATGGAPIGADLGYGPPRLFEPAEVRRIDDFLANLRLEDFARRCDPQAMAAAELYWRSPTTPEEGEEDLATLWKAVGELREFVAGLARRGDGMLVEIY